MPELHPVMTIVLPVRFRPANTGWVDAEARPELQGKSTKDEAFWIYDPIDGAYHYLQGLPLWSASLALIHGDNTIYAAVYDPVTRELFSANKGQGAKLNASIIRVSQKSDLRTAVIGTAIPPYGYLTAMATQPCSAKHCIFWVQWRSRSL